MKSRVKGYNREFISQVAANDSLRQLYEPLVQKCKGHTFEAFAFAILAANEMTSRAELALAAVKNINPSATEPKEEQLREALKACGLMFYKNKAHYISQLVWRFGSAGAYAPNNCFEDESCSTYRDRVLDLNILGLAFCKTSFACMLAYGGGDVVCCDRHVLNIYFNGSYEDWMARNTKKAVLLQRAVEAYFVKIAADYGWASASALQWAVWAEALGRYTEHSVVWS